MMSKETIKETVAEIVKTGNKRYSEQRLKKDILDVLKNSFTVNEYDQDSISRLSVALETCLTKLNDIGMNVTVKYNEIQIDSTEYDENQDRLINLVEQYDKVANDLSDDV